MRETGFWIDLFVKGLIVYASLIFAVLWCGLIIALVFDRGWLDEI